jgi:D-glycero-alpha-D-manno-heptose 1-phosphate guanylyltransferase
MMNRRKAPFPDVSAVILAGGFGTRIQHLVPNTPKPMVPVAGRPFVDWVILYLRKQGIRKVVISTGYREEVFRTHFQEHPIPGVTVQCIPEEKPLGTGGGFLNATEKSEEAPSSWLLLNGDTLTFADVGAGLELLDSEGIQGVLYGVEVPDTSRFGSLELDNSGNLKGYLEKMPGRGMVSTGVTILRHSILDQFPGERPLSIEKQVFPALIAAGSRLRVLPMTMPFLDIGTPETLGRADDFIASNRAQFDA